jgi:HTH-type transcriptional regulator / antitoxin HigA
MPEIDDFFVLNDDSQIDLNKVIEKYKYFKNSPIPVNYLRKHFGILLQDDESNMMFKRKEIANNPLQEFWALRFLDMAENNYENLSIKKFSPLEKNILKEVVNICFSENRINEVKYFLMSNGVYLYFIDYLPGTNIDGAVYITTHSTIAVGLTVRFERLDHIWFTLLHELAHIILHYQFLSDSKNIISIENSQDIIEIESNRLAKDSIISPEKYRICLPKRTRNSNDIIKYSKENNVHPALLAGIIRRDLNIYNIFNDIIEKYKIKRSDLYE